MSRIKDLEIRGIRNFGDESARVKIHFSKPLSLILGPNGTGKTTIIEALKFITSGEYPPDSDRGKSFVHEPKLTLNHTVKGQVKARIVDKRGKEMIATRAMQVTRLKTGTLKFQALDNTITTLNESTNEKVQISSRCADIDREMLIAMGVSKPILNYVIFCHQEESNWPLEDGKKLKDRFDEIFDTSKYNKAMETTTKLIKELTTELNEIKAYESGLKVIVDEVTSQEEQLKDREKREQEGRERISEIDQLQIPIDQRMKEILEIKTKYEKLEDKLKKVETDHKLTTSYIQSLQKHIKQLHTGSKEELISKLEGYDQNLTQKIKTKRGHEDQLDTVEKQEAILTKMLADARIKLGSLTQKKIAFDERVSKRNELLVKALKNWDILQTDSTFTEEEVKDYINQIERKFEEFTISMKEKMKENELEENHIQREVDAYRADKTGIESEINLKCKEKSENYSEIKGLKEKINQIGEAGSKLQSIESNLNSATRHYETLVHNFDEASVKQNLQSEITKKKDIDSKLTQIDQEITSLHQLSTQQAELEMNQKDLQKKENDISSLKDKHKNNLNLLFDGKEIPQKKIKDSLEKIQISLTCEKNNLSKQIEKEQQKLTTLKANLKFKQSDLTKTRSELTSFKEKVYSQCQDKDYNEELLLQNRKVKSLQDQKGIYANQSLMYEEYIKKLKIKSCCPLCERGFQNSSEEKDLEQKLHSEIKKSPQSLKDCEKELKLEQARYDALLQLKPVIDQLTEIETVKIPKISTSIKEIEAECEKSEQNLENLKLVLLEPEEKLSIYKNILEDIILLDRSINEKDTLNETIEKTKRDMLKAGKIGDRSMQEIQNEREAMKKRQSIIEKNIEQMQLNLQAGQEKIQKAREQKNKLNEEVLQIRQNMQSLQQLKAKSKDLYERQEFLEKAIMELRQKEVLAAAELDTKVTELQNLKRKNREEQDKNSNFKSKSATEFHELKKDQQEVLIYISNRIDEKLQEVELDVEKIKKKCEDIKTEKLGLEEHIRSLDEQCRSQESGKKDLENNLDLIRKQESITELNVKLAEYQKLLDELEFEKSIKEYKKLQNDKDKLEKEKSEMKGAQGELETSIRTLKRSLNQEKYRMARHNYKEKQLQLSVQEEAIQNLKAYVTVLDKAMIQFHEERMNTVNKIMHQLWTLVYNGNDTTSIQIRVQTTEGIGDKKRSYNYKLVQVKRSTEMDMKGKCSAGQKVLASIIIRMALAETFCSDCAVLALDEPTTNLDVENATNLANTLSKVIQLRAQHHKNFQLIVISHDEKFISHLSNLSGKQMFQELYRSNEGYSLVKRRDMSDFTKNSQSLDDNNYDESEEDEKSDRNGSRMAKKRQLSLEDSPPHGRRTKLRACY